MLVIRLGLALARYQQIIAVPAIEVVHICRDPVIASVQRIIACVTIEPIRGVRAGDLIVAVTACCCIVARRPAVECAGIDHIVPCATGDAVVAGTTFQMVIGLAALQRVVAGLTKQLIATMLVICAGCSLARYQQIVAIPAIEVIHIRRGIIFSAVQCIIASVAIEPVVAVRADQLVVPVTATGGISAVSVGCSTSGKDDIATRSTGDAVIVGTTFQRIVSTITN